MAHTIVHPIAMVVHSQNTSSTNAAVMGAGRLVVGTLLAVSQVPTLSLDLMDGVMRVFDARGEGKRDPAQVCKNGEDVIRDAHDGDGGENDGVYDSGRGPKTEPPVYEN